ncbi:MAG TPA: transcription antitermination factor NusB [Clostridia bacterium]|jgi:N utilization substance protein B|nr:transcription antitermination factor NusB [Clostridia bacterium]HOS19266.1 transcription antitermination factor NusB [Clostridia bacterium]HPK15600.1 transcription antitermination factor NusB [Clostridia bacterium]
MSRKIAREVAMKHAFARLFGCEDTYTDILDKSDIEEQPTEDDLAYAQEVLSGIREHAEEIDALIRELAINWSIERMPRVDLSILRVAIYEMLYLDDIPESVSINEAVELAKRFGGERSSAYINGMLGTLSKRRAKGEA